MERLTKSNAYAEQSARAFVPPSDEPNELVASYHDRMPLALADDKVELWLDRRLTRMSCWI